MPLVGAIVLILSIYFLAFGVLSQGQTQEARHFLESAQALTAADAGARWGIAVLSDLRHRSSSLGSNFVTDLLTRPVFFSPLQISPPPELQEYVEEIHGTLNIQILPTLKPYGIGVSGFSDDPAEREGEVEVRAIATIGRIKRVVTIVRGMKTYLGVHPVLSKFTLFVKRKPEDAHLNPLEKLSEKRGYENGVPLICLNGANRLSVSPRLDLPSLGQLEKENGWIFLHSAATQPWPIHLAGQGLLDQDDDAAFLPRGMFENPRLANAWNQRLSDQGSSCRVEKAYEYFEGLKSNYVFDAQSQGITIVPTHQYFKTRFFYPDSGTPPRASILRLWGTGDKCTPTLVLGPVMRRFFRFRKMDCVIPPKSYNSPPGRVDIPGFPDENSFVQAFVSPPAGNITKIRVENGIVSGTESAPRNYATDFSLYAAVFGLSPAPADLRAAWPQIGDLFTQEVQDPFLNLFSYLYAWRETSREHPDPPPDPFSQLSLWEGEGSNAASLQAGKGQLLRAGQPVYSGELAACEGIKEFQNKITTVFENEKLFWKKALKNGNHLFVPGVAFVKGNLTIDQKLVIKRGGIIIVKGMVTIRQGITGTPGEPLTITCTRDIVLDTGNQPVHAHLSCLRGTLFAKGGFQICGTLAARQLDFPALLSPFPKTIEFEPSHSFVDSPDYSLYRVALSTQEEYRVSQ